MDKLNMERKISLLQQQVKNAGFEILRMGSSANHDVHGLFQDNGTGRYSVWTALDTGHDDTSYNHFCHGLHTFSEDEAFVEWLKRCEQNTLQSYSLRHALDLLEQEFDWQITTVEEDSYFIERTDGGSESLTGEMLIFSATQMWNDRKLNGLDATEVNRVESRWRELGEMRESIYTYRFSSKKKIASHEKEHTVCGDREVLA